MSESRLEELKLADVRRIEVKPGDVILLRTKDILTGDQITRVRNYLNRYFPRNGVLVLSGETDIDVFTPGEQPYP